jgi:hypothetical protein
VDIISTSRGYPFRRVFDMNPQSWRLKRATDCGRGGRREV